MVQESVPLVNVFFECSHLMFGIKGWSAEDGIVLQPRFAASRQRRLGLAAEIKNYALALWAAQQYGTQRSTSMHKVRIGTRHKHSLSISLLSLSLLVSIHVSLALHVQVADSTVAAGVKKSSVTLPLFASQLCRCVVSVIVRHA